MFLKETDNHPISGSQLPEIYTRFNSLPKLVSGIDTVLDRNSFTGGYRLAWIVLGMSIDKRKQDALVSAFSSQVRNEYSCNDFNNKRVELYREDYWRILEQDSIYPVILEALNDTENSYKTVYSWTDKNWKFSREVGVEPYLQYAAQIYPYIFNSDLAQRSFTGPNITGRNLIRLLFEEIDQSGNNSESLKVYVTSLDIERSAHAMALKPIIDSIRIFKQVNDGTLLLETDLPRKVRSIAEHSEPYYLLSSLMKPEIEMFEQSFFGDNSEEAAALWRSALFLRTNNPQTRFKFKPAGIRRELFTLLVKEEWKEAAQYIENLKAQYPRILPDFIDRRLGINSEERRKALQKEEYEQKLNLLAKKVLETHEQIALREDVSRNVGKKLISSDGEYLSYYLDNQRIEQRPYYHIDRDNTSPRVLELLGAGKVSGISRRVAILDIVAAIELFGLKSQQE